MRPEDTKELAKMLREVAAKTLREANESETWQQVLTGLADKLDPPNKCPFKAKDIIYHVANGQLALVISAGHLDFLHNGTSSNVTGPWTSWRIASRKDTANWFRNVPVRGAYLLDAYAELRFRDCKEDK